jgi:hypothetical protein
MTEFAQETRKMCRNRHCGGKLPAPVSNEREAFCARGCCNSFYLHRCRICEKPIEQPKHGTRLICKKSKCKNAWKAGLGFGRFAESSQASSNSNPVQETLVPQRSAAASKPDRPWRIIAGPQLTPSQFHCATIPDGPDCQWKGGEYERIEAKSRRLLEDYFADLDRVVIDDCAACGREDDLTDIPMAGRWLVLCRGCRTRARDAQAEQQTLPALPSIPDDLSIPDFLRRGAAA